MLFLVMVPLSALLAGCGGTSLGGSQNSSFGNSFDNGLGGGSYGGYGNNGMNGGNRQGGNSPDGGGRGATRGVYPGFDVAFELPDVQGSPFDSVANNVEVTLQSPGKKDVKLPAFFTGGKGWIARHAPHELGKYQVSRVTINGRNANPEKMDKKDFDVTGSPQPGGIIRDSRDKMRFAHENGSSYYPIGVSIPLTGKPDALVAKIEKLGESGGNWARVWMTKAQGLSIDASANGKAEPGDIDVEAAKQWDTVIQAAEKAGVYLQIVLDDDRSYSTAAGSAWDANPWNKKAGGFLTTPDEFFSHSRAVALTKAKLRYVASRWGSSPAIMGWELFSRVERSDAITHKHADEVATWTKNMAGFLRQNDPGHHLVTTSATDDKTITSVLDYVQLASSGADGGQGIAQVDGRNLDKPVFFVEAGQSDTKAEDRRKLVWQSLASESGGAAQLWLGDNPDISSVASTLRAAKEFVKQSSMGSRNGLARVAAGIDTQEKGTLSFAPAGNPGKAGETTVLPSGPSEPVKDLPATLFGSGQTDKPRESTFRVSYAQEGTFGAQIGKVGRGGGKLTIRVDGSTGAEKDFPATGQEVEAKVTVEAKIPAGDHTIKVSNSGSDWMSITQYMLAPYAPAVAAIGKGNADFAVYWLSPRGSQTKGGGETIRIPGLKTGSYRLTWFDTDAGKVLSEDTVSATDKQPLAVTAPKFDGDIALWVARKGDSDDKGKPKDNKKPAKDTKSPNKDDKGTKPADAPAVPAKPTPTIARL
jgi:hypothetical protein